MHLTHALHTRNSTRHFTSQPIPPETLDAIIQLALQAPSWSNTQPYRLAVASGERCEALRQEMLAQADSSSPNPDYNLLFQYPEPLKSRRRATGYGLYSTLGIARDDYAGRGEQFRRNFAFFGAPTVMFLYAHHALEYYSVLDAGCFLQSLLLAATEAGLGSCAQAALASYPDVVARYFDIPAEYKLLCGIALGYPAETPVNTYRPERISPEELLLVERSPTNQ